MTDSDLLDLSNCVFANVRRATRVLSQTYDDFLKPTGLRTTQCMVLAAIAQAGSSTVTELAELMTMEQTSMTRALSALKKRGLIQQVVDEQDQRKRRVVLTEEGGRILMIARPLREAAQKAMIEQIGSEDVRNAVALLSKIRPASTEN